MLIAAVVLAQAIGAVGTIFTARKIPTWYKTLRKPKLSPPNWVFGPVWVTLFTLMGIASFLVWREGWGAAPVKWALLIYAVQFILNVLWSAIFFGMENPGAAFVEIAVLWIAIVGTILAFVQVSTLAACLLLPYLAWVTFASYLNYKICRLNP
jgi:tryptophan-rich sensory protein